jgi:shikimate kinase
VSRLFLVGFMGAGKSTVGRIVAERMGRRFVDLDDSVEERTGTTIAEIFETEGEQAFRELESEVLLGVGGEDEVVVACGGGIVLSDENRRLMRDLGCVIYLAVTPEEALARVGGAQSRPLLAGKSGEVAAGLLDARRKLYESAADFTIDTAGKSPEDVGEEVLAAFETCGRFPDE